METLKAKIPMAARYGLGVFLAEDDVPTTPEHFSPAEFVIPKRNDGVIITPAAEGLLIHVPAGVKAIEPIRLETNVERDTRSRVTILAEEGSEVVVAENSFGSADVIRDSSVDVIVGDGASVTFAAIQHRNGKGDFAAKNGRVGMNGRLRWIDAAFGCEFARSSISTSLEGEGASVVARSAFFGIGRQRFDLSVTAKHLASQTVSDLAGVGAADGASKAIYRGLIRMERGARGCDGRQREDALLLSGKAEIDAIPNLEIETDDVRCAHGASCGGLSPERLFYAASRGITEHDAKRMMLEGFFAGVGREFEAIGLGDVFAEALNIVIARPDPAARPSVYPSLRGPTPRVVPAAIPSVPTDVNGIATATPPEGMPRNDE